MSKQYNVAIVGATGAVGNEFLKVLEQQEFPVKNIKLLASRRSDGIEIEFRNIKYKVEVLGNNSFDGIDVALFSAGSSVSNEFAPIAVNAGAVVIDNSSAFRMDENVPLVVPEVNIREAKNHSGIISNPNCSTIQLVVALKPIYELSPIKRIIVTTFQSVSGTGKRAINELITQTRDVLDKRPVIKEVYPHQIAFNIIPQIDKFEDNHYTLEEMKMVRETQKIFDDSEIQITATTVRVPVIRGHCESVYVETENMLDIGQIRNSLANAEGIDVLDDVEKNIYPTPIDMEGKNNCSVGRIRKDLFNPNGINLWIVADNLLKGAALNAVQVARYVLS